MLLTRPLLPAIALAAAGAVAVLLARNGLPLCRFVVEGDSMLPAYGAGDRVLIYRWAYARNAPAVGDAVVLRDPEMPQRWLLKRIAAAPDAGGSLTVLGDNPAASRDSRTFGAVDRSAIDGKVIAMYARLDSQSATSP